ncbi:BMC domain-containing protein [Lutispora thermophila]|uniref:Carboxysome shell and ethanolamine utilization microcompartment protein CcmL/EutN n=1 Tax=Lutispora thermophila DSM 19022 TaxID=1122184 RepID=A0A1M6FIV7_9FIRM|nr:BMC domain-containing protein [Lutispora thermophila]SHI97569.1 Carboxysome shell and ethanolamine utilization microcompartment protein CcmL/EutN [Lutispora thermophila DSM 19022]
MTRYNDQTALGMLETYGYIAHIEAVDQCLKAANVRLVRSEKVKGGYMHVMIVGDVGAVKAALSAAEAAVERLGLKVVTHVIPRPSEDVRKLMFPHDGKSDSMDVPVESKQEIDELQSKKDGQGKKKNKKQVTQRDQKKVDASTLNLDAEQLSKMNVAKLRAIARSLKNISLDKNQINFGKKQQLIEAILDALKRGEIADEDS